MPRCTPVSLLDPWSIVVDFSCMFKKLSTWRPKLIRQLLWFQCTNPSWLSLIQRVLTGHLSSIEIGSYCKTPLSVAMFEICALVSCCSSIANCQIICDRLIVICLFHDRKKCFPNPGGKNPKIFSYTERWFWSHLAVILQSVSFLLTGKFKFLPRQYFIIHVGLSHINSAA